ncbi:GntR family transcriptional regulator [Mesorhizobium sp. M7A.F.Ca.US.006.01.1.1]|uniref:GntR family transcriptional regulator n=1 Tax=Mesorhizobium sp. M7A.F.Ca.US.006.01.1.1 TaxID=2496707 RepID=UPI000FCB8380|nr:GntR family transcriptional regulator [Mesorhizobium sp. M7A.F.Ca.US.006.01.1.1]RUZ74044.1 GntR family transcriptional regulator [Mesorhizobium sp. M7A.F.Ca.US.006.01.1.1]
MEQSNVGDQARVLARRIEEEIALGLLRPRERLIEDDLMRKFDVKRHVARHVLGLLESTGVVSRERNKGAAVRDFSPREVEQIYDVRELLLGRAAELIPIPAPTDVVAELKAIHARHKGAAAAGDLRTVFRENLKFHAVLEAACGNPHLYEALQQFGYRAHAMRSHTILSPDLLANAIAQHGQMIAALETGDRTSLRGLMVAHIQPAKLAYLQYATKIHPEQPA